MSTDVDDKPLQLKSTVSTLFTLYPRAVSVEPTVCAGAAGATVRLTWLDPTSPRASETVAVIRCVPEESVLENEPPVPICPSRFEVHFRLEVRFPSWVSLAEPENVIDTPYGYEELLNGL